MSYPLCQAPEHWPHQILKGGCRLLCANIADPALAGAARGRDLAVVGAAGMLTGHRPPPAARGYSAAPAAVPGLSAGHGPLRAACNCDPVVAAGVRWTCGPDSSAGG